MTADRDELERLAEYDFTDRNEAEIRGDWIEPLLRLLGYGLGTRHTVMRETQLRLDPAVRMIGSKRYDIDFVPTVFGHRLWIIEAKRPTEDLFDLKHLGQAWSYATDPRVAVPLMMLCDGTRLGVFDMTSDSWSTPALDVPKAALPIAFDDVFSWLGAPRVAERIRVRQLAHLRTALEAQVDLGALDRTIADVQTMVDEVRPIVVARREQIRMGARQRTEIKGRAAVEAAGMWGHAQEVNGPNLPSRRAVERAVEIVRGVQPNLRVREFDDIEKATTPPSTTASRMWFGLRALRLQCAVLLSDDEGCADHCEAAARMAARAHATGFADDPLGAATYRLQRALGRLGWRAAAITKPALDQAAQALVDKLEVEEWLRRDGEMGITATAHYLRVARLAPVVILSSVQPWTAEHLDLFASQTEALLTQMGKPEGFDDLQPAGDPWLDSWTQDPLRDLSAAMLQATAVSGESERVMKLAAELLEEF